MFSAQLLDIYGRFREICKRWILLLFIAAPTVLLDCMRCAPDFLHAKLLVSGRNLTERSSFITRWKAITPVEELFLQLLTLSSDYLSCLYNEQLHASNSIVICRSNASILARIELLIQSIQIGRSNYLFDRVWFIHQGGRFG